MSKKMTGESRILIVDDNSANLQLLMHILTEHGYTVHPASDGGLALRFLESTLPDLILLDVKMPRMDGYEVCRRLKADTRTSSIPIIFISALDTASDKVKAFQAGGVDYIAKPFSPDEVLARVDIQLRLRELTEQLEEKISARTEELMQTNQQLHQEIDERKTAQESLLREQMLLNRIMVTSPVGITLVNREGQITFANPQAERILGLSKQELTQLSYNAPEWHATAIDGGPFSDEEHPFSRVMTARQPVFDVQHAIAWPDGRRVLLSINGAPIFDHQGEIEAVVFAIEDITERKQTEERILKSEQRLRLHMELSPLCFLEWDENFCATEWNSTCEKIFGYSREEALGRHATELILPVESHKLADGIYHDLMGQAGGQHSINENITRDGCVITVEWFNTTLIDKDGKAIGVASIGRNITDIKQAEAELHRLNRELQAISNCNQSLLKATDEQELLNDICGIICKQAGYLLAWVGYAENDATKTIRPIAWAGEGSDYIANAKLSWSENIEHGRGPAGVVIRSGEALYIEDFEESALMTPWRQSALQKGYHSGIALPLKNGGGQPFGALMIYSAEKNAINADEIRLLEELAGDMAYGISNLRARAESKRAEEALRDNEAFLETVLDNIPTMIFVKDAEKLQFIRFNKFGQELIGFSQQELIGKSDYDFSPKEEADFFIAKDKEVILSGELKDIPEEPINTKHHGQRYLHTRKVPIIGEDGTTLYLLGISEDITERKLADEALKRSADALAEAQRIAKLGNWELNLVSNELVWSDEIFEIFEIDRKSFGASYEAFLNAIHPDDRDKVNKAFTDSVSNHHDYEVSHRLLMKDGRVKIVQEQGRNYLDADGNPLRSVGTVQDITHQQETEMQLQQAQKMEALGTLVGGIAHDFNNKLAAMIGNLFLAQSEIDASSNAAKRLKAVEKLSFEASNMIKQLLTFARKGNVQQEPLILQSFIKETTKLNRVAIPENIRLSISCCNNPLQIQGDITQLQQIFLNLLTNARDALEGVNNAHIEITLDLYEPDADFYGRHPQLEKKNNTCARIQFRDNGPGISAEIQKLIFDPFFTTKDVGKGTGLGLATVYGAIQAHHGVIEVVSAPGEGTCFRIYLPIYENSSPRAEAKLETDLVAGNRETILFADDDINVLQTSVEMLELIGYRILPAHDGTEALKIYQEHWQTIDLVILDIVMPGMSGGELAKHIRKINAHAKILFATGYDPSQSSNSVEDTSKILLKPFTIKQVSQTIRKMLEA